MAEGFSKVFRDRKSTMARTIVDGVCCGFLSRDTSSMRLALPDGGAITNLALLIRAAIKDNRTCKKYCCAHKYMTKIADLNVAGGRRADRV